MLQCFHKILTTLLVSISVISTPSIHAASTIKNIRYATALLRGPATYLEHRFRNDTSFRAHAIRMAIDSVRMLDDLLVPLSSAEGYSLRSDLSGIINGTNTRHHLISWFIYDIAAFIKDGKACIEGESASPVVTTDDQEHEFLRSTILPAAEMICALVRATPTAGKSNNLANIVMSMVRLCELYYAAPQNSAKRTAIKCLLSTCIIELLVKSNRSYKIQQRAQQPGPRPETLLDENFNIILEPVWSEKWPS